jgi:hypothetical protein
VHQAQRLFFIAHTSQISGNRYKYPNGLDMWSGFENPPTLRFLQRLQGFPRHGDNSFSFLWIICLLHKYLFWMGSGMFSNIVYQYYTLLSNTILI